MKQNKLTFNKTFRSDTQANTPMSWEMDAVIPEIELKRAALKAGYIIKDLRSQLVIVTTCMAAKANWSKAEREKAQKQIDETPTPTTIQFSLHKPPRQKLKGV